MFAVPVHGPAASQYDCFLQEDLLTVHVTLWSLDPGDIGYPWRVERKGVVGKTGLEKGRLRSLAWSCLITTSWKEGAGVPALGLFYIYHPLVSPWARCALIPAEPPWLPGPPLSLDTDALSPRRLKRQFAFRLKPPQVNFQMLCDSLWLWPPPWSPGLWSLPLLSGSKGAF